MEPGCKHGASVVGEKQVWNLSHRHICCMRQSEGIDDQAMPSFDSLPICQHRFSEGSKHHLINIEAIAGSTPHGAYTTAFNCIVACNEIL